MFDLDTLARIEAELVRLQTRKGAK